MRPRFRSVFCMFPVALVALSLYAALAQEPVALTEPAHLRQAAQLVESLRGVKDNHYGGGKRHIDWDSEHCSARTVCSSFTTLLLQHSYGWSDADIKSWLDETNPEANTYHDAIASKNRFLRVVHVSAIRPGDFLAVKYTDHHVSSNGVEDTGHVMLVAENPQAMAAQKPIVAGTQQYVVTVIDSSATGHGPKDTRHKSDGSFTGGIGRGEMRLYSNEDGKLVGYTWSVTPKSAYFTSPNREMVAGRLLTQN